MKQQAQILQQATSTDPQTTRWEIDPTHTEVAFSVRHMFTRFRGRFRAFRGAFTLQGLDPATLALEAEVDAASVDTDLEARDEHLRSADFFHVAEHPKLLLRARRVEPAGEDRYRLVADLTIRGVTKEVAFDLETHGVGPDAWGGVRAGATATAKISRKDFGLNWNAIIETGGLVVGDEVTIHLDVEAIRKDA